MVETILLWSVNIRAWPGLLVGCYLGLTAGAAKKFKLKHSFEKFENSLR